MSFVHTNVNNTVNDFVPYYVERDFHRNSRITEVLYTAHTSWVNAYGTDVIGAKWLFGRTASGEYLAEKIEHGGATRQKRAWSLPDLEGMVTWYRDRDWTVTAVSA